MRCYYLTLLGDCAFTHLAPTAQCVPFMIFVRCAELDACWVAVR